MTDRNSMLKEISGTSFMLDDLRLYLDTHPQDEPAMAAYEECADRRRQLMKDYADQFEPLTCDSIRTKTSDGQKHWTWADGPIPWDTEANACAAMKGGN